MKNVVNELISDLYRKVPMEILREAFHDELKMARSLDAIIKDNIIIGIVLANCNLYAGKITKITLRGDYSKDLGDNFFVTAMAGGYGVYCIPPEARENRPIVAIMSISYPTSMASFGSFPNVGTTGRSVTNGLDEMLSSFTHEPVDTSPSGFVLDSESGLIQLSPPASVHIDWMMSCMLAFDNEFSNIGLNMINPLKVLVEFATKSYIYNKLIIKINQGYLQGGLQLDAIRSIIESYENANERFDEALLKFRGANNFSPENVRSMISMMFGS